MGLAQEPSERAIGRTGHTLEHVIGLHGDRQALTDIARVVKPGGQALVSVPFRAAGSAVELDPDLRPYQRHYSPATLQSSLLDPSGLEQKGGELYGERLPFYRLSTRLPGPLGWLRRPWDSLLSALVLRPVEAPEKASAVLCDLRQPT